VNGRALVVLVGGEVCLWAVLRGLNPGVFRADDEARLRRGETIERAGLQIRRTSDETCILCGVPVGKGATRCHPCEHRDEGSGYSGRPLNP
jgi:hypothetical protein